MERIILSHKTLFIPQHVDGRIWICHLLYELLLHFIEQNIHNPVMTILCFRERFNGRPLKRLLVVEQTMSTTDCLNIITDHLHHYLLSEFRNGNGGFMQGNASCQMTRIMFDWFEEYNTEFQLTP